MGGFSNDGDDSVVFADNVDFSAGFPVTKKVTTNGQLLIGSTTAPNIRVGLLTSSGGTVAITSGSGSINLEAGSSTPTTFITDSGNAVPASNQLNVLGSGSITTSGSGSTLTTQLTGLTNHSVLVGAGTTTITKVAPSATSGIPLVSNGSSADPSFTTAVVAGGGTGNTTFTAYSVICAGTTATGAFQNVSGVGNSGQVLTSNGASALPTWQTVGSSFTPQTTIEISDDFLGAFNATITNADREVWSEVVWTSTSAWMRPTNATEAAHPGILSSQSAASGRVMAMAGGASTGTPGLPIIFGGGAISISWVFNIVNLSNGTNRYTLKVGFGDTTSTIANGAFLSYSDNVNSGNWVMNTTSASTPTTSNTATAATTGWQKVTVNVNANASSVEFFLNGSSLGTIATNIPSAAVTPCFTIAVGAGTIAAGTFLIDLFYLTQALTSAR